MPWVSSNPDEIYLPTPLGVDAGSEPAPPSASSIWGSAYEQNNLIPNVMRAVTQSRYDPDPNYTPYTDPQIVGTKYESQWSDKFVHSYSAKETSHIISDIDREEKNNEILSRGGITGLVASAIMGTLDPTILIPGGVLVRGVKGGYSALRRGMSVGAAALTQVGLQELGLQATQRTRPLSDSIVNVGTATLLGAILGTGAAKLLSKGESQVLTRALEAERQNVATNTIPQAGGSAPSDIRTGELRPLVPGVVSKAYEKGKEYLGKVPYVGTAMEKIASFPEWLATKNSPLLRMATSESVEARRAAGDLAINPLETIDNTKGIVSTKFGLPLEMDVKLAVHTAQVDMYEQANKAFRDYRGNPNAILPATTAWMERKFGKSSQLTYDEFMTAVDDKLRYPDSPSIPQVAALAQEFRKWTDVVKKLAKEQKIDIGDTVLGAPGYAPRVINKPALIARRNEFIDAYVKDRKVDQNTKLALRDQIGNAWDVMMQARAQGRRLDDRISTADKRIGLTEARLSERGMEAKATVDRAMSANDRAKEARAAVDELKSFVDELKGLANTPEIKSQISELQSGIRELEGKTKPLTEADLGAMDKAERDGILVGPMRRVARILSGKSKSIPKPPSFWKYIAKIGGVKDDAGDLFSRIGNKPRGLFVKDGFQWDDLQTRLMEDFPEVRAMWDRAGPAEDFSNDIREMITDSVDGKEPDWFLDHQWNADDRFVFEMTGLLNEASNKAGVEFKTMNDVADFVKGEPVDNLTENDLAKMEAHVSDTLDTAVDVDGLQQSVKVRQQTLDLFHETLAKNRAKLASAKGKSSTATAVMKEAGTNANRNLGRLGVLNERAAKAEQIKEFLEQAKSVAKKSEQDQLQQIEDLLNKWEGSSSKEAKAALLRRAERDAERTPEQKAKYPRLGSADKPIARAVRRILKHTEKSDQELAAEGEKTAENYLSTPDGRIPDGEPGTVQQHFGTDVGDLRGSLNARRNPMSDASLRPFLITNPIDYMMGYMKQSMSDLGMIARYGDTKGTSALNKIIDDYNAKIRAATTEKERTRLQKGKDRDIRDFAIMRDRIKGTYGFSPDAFLQQAGRIAETTKSFAVSTLGGGFGLAQFPDFGGSVFRHGLQSTFRDGWVPFFNKLMGLNKGGMKAASHEWKAFKVGAETFLNTRNLDAMDVTDVYHHRTPFERTMRNIGAATVQLSGMDIVTDAQKTIIATVGSNNFLRAAKAVTEGKATQFQITELAAGYIDDSMAARIWNSFKDKGGTSVDGVMLPNLDDWADQGAAKTFKAAILRDTEIGVLTPGEEKPAFLSNPILGILGQFKTFVAAANTRILLANLQRRDATTLSGLLAYLATGMMSYAAYKVVSGGEISDRPQDWIKEGADRSGLWGWFGEFNAVAAKATGGSFDLYRLIGADKPLSRRASTGLVSSLFGPAVGQLENLTGMVYDASSANWSDADVTKLRRLLPFQNLFYIRRLIDEVQKNADTAFGIPPKEANGR